MQTLPGHVYRITLAGERIGTDRAAGLPGPLALKYGVDTIGVSVISQNTVTALVRWQGKAGAIEVGDDVPLNPLPGLPGGAVSLSDQAASVRAVEETTSVPVSDAASGTRQVLQLAGAAVLFVYVWYVTRKVGRRHLAQAA